MPASSLSLPEAFLGALMAPLTRLEAKFDALETEVHALRAKIDTHHQTVDDKIAHDGLIIHHIYLLLNDKIESSLVALQNQNVELKDNTCHLIVANGTLHAQNGLIIEMLDEIREYCRNRMRQN